MIAIIIIIALVFSVIVGIALYFTNVLCSLGIGNKCSSPEPSPAQAPSLDQEPSSGTACLGRFYKECTTDGDCQTGQKCEPITINFSQVLMCK